MPRTKRQSSAKKDRKLYSTIRSTNLKAGTKKRSSANFTWFLKIYKGMNDWHIPIFRETVQYTKAMHVLYAGCDKHITPSLFFQSVVYVDCNKKLEGVFQDENVLQWVTEKKVYSDEAKIKFLCKNFDSKFEKEASFDLIISASAGIVSKACTKYLKPDGFFLVSDAHFDARTAFLRPDFELVGVFEKDTGKLLTSATDIEGHFYTTEQTPITQSQVDESMKKPKSRRSFTLMKEAMFYLFKKLK